MLERLDCSFWIAYSQAGLRHISQGEIRQRIACLDHGTVMPSYLTAVVINSAYSVVQQAVLLLTQYQPLCPMRLPFCVLRSHLRETRYISEISELADVSLIVWILEFQSLSVSYYEDLDRNFLFSSLLNLVRSPRQEEHWLVHFH